MSKMMRPCQIHGHEGQPLPVGSTKFWADYVHDPAGPAVQFIPGTNIPRLKFTKIGGRAVAGFADEVEALVEALRAERDAKIAAGPTIEPAPPHIMSSRRRAQRAADKAAAAVPRRRKAA